MGRLIAIAAILIAVVEMGRTPMTSTDSQIFRCWLYSATAPDSPQPGDDWLGATSRVAQVNQLTPEPGMPQALGFANWQALYDDIVSENGVIAEVTLRFESSTASNGQAQSVEAHPTQGRHHPIWNVMALPRGVTAFQIGLVNPFNLRDKIAYSLPVGTTNPRSAQGSGLLNGWFCPTGPVVGIDCCSSGELSLLIKRGE